MAARIGIGGNRGVAASAAVVAAAWRRRHATTA